jgi:hypothetical protein
LDDQPAMSGLSPDTTGETRAKFRPPTPQHMPRDFSISLDALRRGGTDAFLGQPPQHAKRQALPGFEPQYVNIIDYIVRITHQSWEDKDIGYIYDTYSHDCMVWDDFGLNYGRDKVVADTVAMNNAFPDIRIVADEVIWAGTRHKAFTPGTAPRFSAPTPASAASARPPDGACNSGAWPTALPATTRSSTSTWSTIPPR